MTAWPVLTLLLFAGADAETSRAEAIAAIVDRRIDETLTSRQIPAPPPATDAEFFRRLTLDLRGHIPTPLDVRQFLDDASPDKRSRAIAEALAHADHPRHFATIWRRLLLPEAESQAQIQYFLPGFEAWLQNIRREDVGFDVMVRELVAAPIHGTPDSPQVVLTDLAAPNPIAYIATKEADPGKIAGGVTRLFLGVRLECAQCHDHPFDKWTREQFWNQAAFFAGISRRGRGAFAPVVEARDKRSIGVMDTGASAEVVFLTGGTPTIAEGISPRVAYAAWMTSPENPFFAKAVVNRVWAQLMGVGLVDPVDDFQVVNPPSHPELLDELATAFIDSGFQLDVLYAGICQSKAYQRTSRQTDAAQADGRVFARMAVKPMSAEQLYDSLLLVTGESTSRAPGRRGAGDGKRRFLDLFATPDASGEPLTSMPQALFLMNGGTVNRAAALPSGVQPKAQSDGTAENAKVAIEDLYLSVLSRRPTEAELKTASDHVSQGAAAERASRLGDVLWALLNLPEFRWNH
jgi:hypothetical protein